MKLGGQKWDWFHGNKMYPHCFQNFENTLKPTLRHFLCFIATPPATVARSAVLRRREALPIHHALRHHEAIRNGREAVHLESVWPRAQGSTAARPSSRGHKGSATPRRKLRQWRDSHAQSQSQAPPSHAHKRSRCRCKRALRHPQGPRHPWAAASRAPPPRESRPRAGE